VEEKEDSSVISDMLDSRSADNDDDFLVHDSLRGEPIPAQVPVASAQSQYSVTLTIDVTCTDSAEAQRLIESLIPSHLTISSSSVHVTNCTELRLQNPTMDTATVQPLAESAGDGVGTTKSPGACSSCSRSCSRMTARVSGASPVTRPDQYLRDKADESPKAQNQIQTIQMMMLEQQRQFRNEIQLELKSDDALHVPDETRTSSLTLKPATPNRDSRGNPNLQRSSWMSLVLAIGFAIMMLAAQVRAVRWSIHTVREEHESMGKECISRLFIS
jgi:hypothetical protein